jgi:hypothetical protein
MQRAFDSVAGLHSGLVATKVDIQQDGKRIELIWPNKHVTTFDADWMYERRLPEEVEQQAAKVLSFCLINKEYCLRTGADLGGRVLGVYTPLKRVKCPFLS